MKKIITLIFAALLCVAAKAQGENVIRSIDGVTNEVTSEQATNLVQENSFIRLQSKLRPGWYVQNVNSPNGGLALSEDTGKNSIFLIRGGSLLSYSTGFFVASYGFSLQFAATPEAKSDVEIIATTSDPTVYGVRHKDSRINRDIYLYASQDNDVVSSVISLDKVYEYNDAYQFTLEQVTELPITMNLVEGGYYGTINFPVAVELPNGLSAYSATENTTSITLTKVAGGGQVLAANTPVIIYSDSNVESLTISSEDGIGAADNCLLGTVEAKSVESGANYVLGNKQGLAFYKYTNYRMPAFKAYLAPSSTLSQKFGFTFADDDLTGIASAIKEAAHSNTTVFDINGRMVNELVKGQLYIQGGKKFRY